MSEINYLNYKGATYDLAPKDGGVSRAKLSTELQNIITRLESISNGPLVASTVAQMTDATKVYVYVGNQTGYTNGNWYYYNGSVWVSGGVYNSTALQTDTTLSVSGQAADAKVTGDQITELKDNLSEYESIFTGDVDESVQNWLDDHPEATTAVQDGSLTEVKFSETLKLNTIKDYVTPQMYGAKGDGVTDDTTAINQALSASDVVIFPKANYKISNPIVINGDFKRVYQYGTINYSGADSAVKITGCSNCEFRFDAIVARNGNCIELFTSGLYERNQYIELHFNYLASGDKCVYLNREGSGSPEQYGWINEIHIYGGRFYSGNYGVWADGKGNGSCINNIKIYNAGVEGVTTGFYLANGAQRWSFVNCRYAELFDYILETVGAVYAIQFIGSNFVRNSWLNLSSDTYGMILAPILSDDGSRYLGNFAYIQLGQFIPITMNPETGSISNIASGATVAITNYNKVGNVCNLSLALNVTAEITNSTALMTLSFKPAARQEVIIFNNDGTFIAGYILTDGVLHLQKNLPVKNAYFIQMTYLTKLY